MKCTEEAIPPFSFHVTTAMETDTANEALILSFKGVAEKSVQPCPPAKSQAWKVMRVCVFLHAVIKQQPCISNGQTCLISMNQLPLLNSRT